MSSKVNGTLLVSKGSTSNIDTEAELLSSGHYQIRAFNLNNTTDDGYDFDTDGFRLGWGLPKSVGVPEHPTTGGIYSVNQATRDGQDVHEDSTGEGVNGTKYSPQGIYHGYPYCLAAWVTSDLAMNSYMTVGANSPLEIKTTLSMIHTALSKGLRG